jgi:hypothetical protein
MALKRINKVRRLSARVRARRAARTRTDALPFARAGVDRSRARPTVVLQRWPDRRQQHVPVASDDHGPGEHPFSPARAARLEAGADSSVAGRLAIRRRRVLPLHHLPDGLPVQAAQGQLHNEDLPPQHQRERLDLPRHSPGPVVACLDHLEGYVLAIVVPPAQCSVSRVIA